GCGKYCWCSRATMVTVLPWASYRATRVEVVPRSSAMMIVDVDAATISVTQPHCWARGHSGSDTMCRLYRLVAMSYGYAARLRPRFLVRDRAVLTGHAQRDPQRFGVTVTDPVSGVPFEVAVFKYPGPPGAPQLLAVHGFRGDHHGLELIVDGLTPYEIWVPDLPGFGVSGPLPDAPH